MSWSLGATFPFAAPTRIAATARFGCRFENSQTELKKEKRRGSDSDNEKDNNERKCQKRPFPASQENRRSSVGPADVFGKVPVVFGATVSCESWWLMSFFNEVVHWNCHLLVVVVIVDAVVIELLG